MIQLLRAEWTKFWTVRRWVVAVTAGALLAVVASTFFASASSTNANEAPQYLDEFHFVHQALEGDGSIVTRVGSQDESHEWAKAGLMVKQSPISGAPYAALFVTPRHGVRLQSNFDTDVPGSTASAPRWLKLTRTGAQVSGFESPDGTQWTAVGTVTLDGLPAAVEVGLFVTSPGVFTVDRKFGSTSTGFEPTLGRASFEQVSLTGTTAGGEWVSEDISTGTVPQPAGGGTIAGTSFTVTGSGDIVRMHNGDDDPVMNSLGGVLICLIFIIVISVLFITSEYRKGLIRTTLSASPLRGRALVAKALVAAAVGFVAGLLAAAGSYVISRPAYAANGYSAPSYPVLPISHPTVLRAVVGTALMLSLVAVLGVSLGTMLRRGASAVALLIAAFVAPQILLSALPLDAALWIGRTTPIAGMAIQQTRERWDTAISPWAGLGVLAGYAVLGLAAAVWRLRRRDA